MKSYCSLCTFKVPKGANNLILCTLDTIHRLFFVTRLIINQINKVQWVNFKLENVLVSLHSLKTMGLGSIIFKEWRVTWTFSYTSWFVALKNGMFQNYVSAWKSFRILFNISPNFIRFVKKTAFSVRQTSITHLLPFDWLWYKTFRILLNSCMRR